MNESLGVLCDKRGKRERLGVSSVVGRMGKFESMIQFYVNVY